MPSVYRWLAISTAGTRLRIPLAPSSAGVWEGFVPGVGEGALYKYHLVSRNHDYEVDKADPCGFAAEIRPSTASRVWNLDGYEWQDADWMAHRAERNALRAPVSIYEVHLGSWRRVVEEGNRWLSYRELAPLLADYVRDAGFTHVEFLPVMEHPFDGSWGYETIGYFTLPPADSEVPRISCTWWTTCISAESA